MAEFERVIDQRKNQNLSTTKNRLHAAMNTEGDVTKMIHWRGKLETSFTEINLNHEQCSQENFVLLKINF